MAKETSLMIQHSSQKMLLNKSLSKKLTHHKPTTKDHMLKIQEKTMIKIHKKKKEEIHHHNKKAWGKIYLKESIILPSMLKEDHKLINKSIGAIPKDSAHSHTIKEKLRTIRVNRYLLNKDNLKD